MPIDNHGKAPCLKCKKPMLMNKTGICKVCIMVECYWCGVKCRSTLVKPVCADCHKRSQATLQAKRAALLERKGEHAGK